MNTKEAVLLDIIPKIKEYLSSTTIIDKSYADFIDRNKNIFICNLYNVNVITDDDIRLLYMTIEQNITIDDQTLVSIFSYIGYKFERGIRNQTSDVINEYNDAISDDMRYNLYDVIFNNIDMFIRQKRISILVHDDTRNDISVNHTPSDITSSFDIDSDPNVREIPFNMRDLLPYIAKNLDQMRFSKKFLEFAYLCRNIGIPISKKKFNVKYVYMMKIDELMIPVVIKDYLDVKYVYVAELNKVYKNNFSEDAGNNLRDWGKLLITKLQNRTLYSYIFLSSKHLCDMFIDLIDTHDVSFIPTRITDVVSVSEPSTWSREIDIEYRPCEHQIRLEEVLKVDLDYHSKINSFVAEFLYYEDGLAYCNLCGMNVPIFNLGAADVTKNSVLVGTYNRSIFLGEPYTYFVHSQRFIFNIIMSFDTIMRAQTWSMKYNINRLILNFLISINNNRQEYEKRFASEIKRGIFFLRLAANLFDIHMSSVELFYSAKILNLNYIAVLVIVLNSSADFIMSYMLSKKKPITTEDDLNYAISVVINDFLVKTRICEKNSLDTIIFFSTVYMSIMPEELVAHHQRIYGELKRLLSIQRTRKKPNYDVDNIMTVTMLVPRFFPATAFDRTDTIFTSVGESTSTGLIIPRNNIVPTEKHIKDFDNIVKSTTRVLIRVNDTNAINPVFFTTHVKVEVEKKKIIIPLKKLFVTNVLKYYSTTAFYIFKFGDPFPFDSVLIDEEHVQYKVNGYNLLRHSLIPDSEIFVYFGSSLQRFELEFSFYMFLLNYVDVARWMVENASQIRDLYLINFNN